MKIDEIKNTLYVRFGAFSLTALKILKELSISKNLHKATFNCGVGYRTVRDVALLFPNEIILDNSSGDLSVSSEFSYNVLKSIESKCISYDEIQESILNSIKSFNHHNSDLDHISADSMTLYKRAIELYENYDVHNCKFLFLGDHDFTSIVFALFLQKANLISDITVLDIDDNVLSHIEKMAKLYNLKIKTFYSDFRYIIPSVFHNYFDVIFTDPPYTPDGINTFVSKASTMIKQNTFSSILICYKSAEQSNGLGFLVQKNLNNNGLYISELKKNFNTYSKAEAIGYRSDLYNCLITSKHNKNQSGYKNEINIYTHGKYAVEKINNINNYEKLNEFLYSISNSFYIGENPSIEIPNKITLSKFIIQKESGNFHENTKNTYILDISRDDEMLLRSLLWCSFDSFYLITSKDFFKTTKNNSLLRICQEIFIFENFASLENYSIHLLTFRKPLTFFSKCIGRRGSMRNTIVKEVCLQNKITQNQARSIVDSWKIDEFRFSSLYFLPISKIIHAKTILDDLDEYLRMENDNG